MQIQSNFLLQTKLQIKHATSYKGISVLTYKSLRIFKQTDLASRDASFECKNDFKHKMKENEFNRISEFLIITAH